MCHIRRYAYVLSVTRFHISDSSCALVYHHENVDFMHVTCILNVAYLLFDSKFIIAESRYSVRLTEMSTRNISWGLKAAGA